MKNLCHAGKSGQVMTEYMVVAAMMLAAMAIFMLLKSTFVEYGDRILTLVGSEYP